MVLHIFAHNFLNIQLIFNPQKFWKAETQGFPAIPSNAIYVGGVKGYFNLRHLQHALTYIAFDGMVKKP